MGSALALAASLALPASAATRAGSSSGQLVAAGTVTATSGQVMPGAKVSLYAWPSDKFLAAMKPGQDVPRRLLTSTTTASSGTFRLKVPAGALSAAAVSGPYANLEVDSGTSTWFITQRVSDWTPATVHLTDAADATVPDYCVTQYKGQLKRRLGTVGQEYDWGNAPGVEQAFTYHAGQTTTLSIGISKTGKPGSFSIGGSEAESAASNLDFPVQKGPGFYHFRTLWRVAKYLKTCGGGKIQRRSDVQGGSQTIVRVNDWVGVANVTRVSSAPRASICGL